MLIPVQVADSHKQLVPEDKPAGAREAAPDVDVEATFAQLEVALSAFDPGAVDLVDQLLSSQPEGSEFAQTLADARELLDAFNFDGAAPLLAGVKEGLKDTA